jgi:MFS family permease
MAIAKEAGRMTEEALAGTGHDSAVGDRRRWMALYVLCVGMLMIVLDVTVVNVALPSIQSDLGFSQSSLAWVVNAYLIAFGGLLLLAGRFGDILGRKNIFMAGLALFTVASFVCGAAQSQEMLVIARFVQGIGGAMTSAVILGMIVVMFPEPREQAKAIGVYGFVASAGGSVGLLAGGVLTQSINWHWIFFVNIPIAIVTAFGAMRLVDRDKGIGFGGGADVPGAVLITTSLMLGVYTIVKPAAEQGWGSTAALGLGAASLALLAAFVAWEAKTRNPLIPLRIFRSRNVSGANVIQALTVAGMFGLFFLGSLYLERVLGYDALEIGLSFLPATLIMGVLSFRYGAADHPLRRPSSAADGTGPHRSGPGRLCPGPGGRQLPRERAAADDPAGLRDRRGVPVPHDARHVGRHPGGCGARLGPRQHHRPGRRRAGARGARDSLRDAQRRPDRERAIHGRGAHRRLSPRFPDRRRLDRGRARCRAHGAPGRGEGGGGGRARRRGRPAEARARLLRGLLARTLPRARGGALRRPRPHP